MTYCPGFPHEGHETESEPCPLDHPMHISRVRARRAADEAERALFAEIEPPRQTVMGMLRRVLSDNEETEP